ncbi:MAG: T9SS type A sorting domain-containing protein [Salinivirgaceae bacterium]|nr:T9SS type A sorting domain-containing protein [Salinivirgaceae bacterium]
MYDFSLEEGDSIWLQGYYTASYWYYVDSIRTFETLVGPRKIWYLHYNEDEYKESPIWVEGIGSLAGLYRYSMQPRLDWWGWGILNCWYSGEKLIYKSDFAEQYGCRLELIDIEQVETFNIKLFPNPANNSVCFEFENGYCKNTKIEIFNYLGEKIFQTEICDNNYQLNTASFSNGMYVYVITENEKIRFANKFIVKH